jgi:exodeoxyribonuclease VII small subunit
MTPPTGSTDDPIDAESIGYTDALAELDAILRELESSDVDVDRLADRVARAADLISLCRDRIGTARLRIDAVIADLDTDVDAGQARSDDQ